MILRAMCLVLVLGAFCFAAHGQAAERAQQIQRVVDGINSPDPVTRIVTLEEAMANGDKNIQRMAISAALSSSDQTLRIAGVEAAFSNKSSFVVEFVSGPEGRMRFAEYSGGRLEIYVRNFDTDSGEFDAYTPYSQSSRGDINSTRISRGVLSGDRLSFDVGVWQLSTGESCTGSVSGKGGSAVMTGTMACGGTPYEIKVDLLR